MEELFERIFNKVYRYVKCYSIAWSIAAFGYLVIMLFFRIEMIKGDSDPKISISATQGEQLLHSIRPHNKLSAHYTDAPMEDDMQLSIIIPAYNVEKYIEECIQSVLNQKTQYSYELIVINDGSSDSTLEKIYQYGSEKNIRIVNQENSGFSGARNRGLDLAVGRYIMFIDSDDRLAPGALETLLSEAIPGSVDIVEGNFACFQNLGGAKYPGAPLWNKRIAVDLKENPSHIMKIKGYPWMKVYARYLWEEVRFPIGLWFEDTIITLVIFRRARNYVFVPNVVYEHRQHDMSATVRSRGTAYGFDTYYAVTHCIDECKRLSIDFDILFYQLLMYQFGGQLYHRIYGQSSKSIEALLVMCKKVLDDFDEYCPPDMDYISKCLKKSIINQNVSMWERCCDPFFFRVIHNKPRKYCSKFLEHESR